MSALSRSRTISELPGNESITRRKRHAPCLFRFTQMRPEWPMPVPLHVSFTASSRGQWRITRNSPVIGEGMPSADFLSILEGKDASVPAECSWVLRGTTSNTRYTNKSELDSLVAQQAGLHRTEATCAALIPIRKTAEWWDMAQDERRAIFEEQSRHIGIGHEYL